MHVELRAITKEYGRTRALDRVSCTLTPGQIVAVVGANGAGKTTLLRTLAGIVRPSEGEVLYDGMVFHRGRLDLRRRLHFVPDFPPLFYELNPLQHLGLTLRVYEMQQAGMEHAIFELLRDFDLLPLARSPLGSLSRGQLYKFALVQLMAVAPELWLLDEPFASGMDPHGIDTFRQRARKAAARGCTVIFSTQLLDQAERFADRVCILHHGKLLACETVSALRTKFGGDEGALERLFRTLREARF